MQDNGDRTARFRADMPFAYAQAILQLTEYARSHGEEFEYGPLDLAALRRGGLVVTGPDLNGVTGLLSGLPGLVEVPA